MDKKEDEGETETLRVLRIKPGELPQGVQGIREK